MIAGFALLSLLLAATPHQSTAPRNPGMTYEGYTEAWSIAMKAGKFDAAEQIATEGQAKYPSAFVFHFLIGEALSQRKREAAAFYEYEWEVLRTGADRPAGKAAAERAADMAAARGTEGDEVRTVVEALDQMRTNPDAAVETSQKLADHRDDFIVHLFLAEALVKASRPGEAIPLYRELIHRDPNFVAAYVELALLLKKSAKGGEADSLLAKARSIDPDNWRLKAM
jgi:tetratricopeptide (TPR) repeat protein